jgi:Domain of unknown function (DUF1996)
VTAAVLVACSSSAGSPGQGPSASGTIRHLHFTRLGFATNCQFVETGTIGGAIYDEFGGLPGAVRQGPLSATPVPGSSCLRPGLDHSVFASAAMLIRGLRQPPHAAFAYYLALTGITDVDVFPPGLQMTATHVQFSCAHGGAPRKPAPYDCRPVASIDPMVDAWVTFPSCWDGNGTAAEDVAYPAGSTCPAGFPRYLPRLQATFSWNIPDGTGATFSTGPFEARWTNGWDQRAIAALVRDCIRHPSPCGAVVNYFHRTPLPPSSP